MVENRGFRDLDDGVLACFTIPHLPVDRLEAEGMIGIAKQRVKHDATQALVLRILVDGLLDLFGEIVVGVP